MDLDDILTTISLAALILTIVGLLVRDRILARRTEE